MTKSELLQTAKPILFNTEMVRAILDGRKTVTRRVVKPQPIMDDLHRPHHAIPIRDRDGMFHFEYLTVENIGCDAYPVVPRYNVGDILYVRETWGRQIRHGGCFLAYKVDDEDLMNYDVGKNGSFPTSKVKWKPSIHMPKYAVRIFLRVTGVRLERLQDMGNQDAQKEGVIAAGADVYCGHGAASDKWDFSVENFATLWDSTIKKADLEHYSWNANPWVWVYEFEVINYDS